jgi:hypothetical protein
MKTQPDIAGDDLRPFVDAAMFGTPAWAPGGTRQGATYEGVTDLNLGFDMRADLGWRGVFFARGDVGPQLPPRGEAEDQRFATQATHSAEQTIVRGCVD